MNDIDIKFHMLVGLPGSTSSPQLDDELELDTIQDVVWNRIELQRRVGAGAFGEGWSVDYCFCNTFMVSL
jgi:hypothetical protein